MTSSQVTSPSRRVDREEQALPPKNSRASGPQGVKSERTEVPRERSPLRRERIVTFRKRRNVANAGAGPSSIRLVLFYLTTSRAVGVHRVAEQGAKAQKSSRRVKARYVQVGTKLAGRAGDVRWDNGTKFSRARRASESDRQGARTETVKEQFVDFLGNYGSGLRDSTTVGTSVATGISKHSKGRKRW